PAFYQSEGSEVARVNERLMDLEAELTTLYARWESLEARR
ncbi:MAG: hypothetical protein EOM91_18535, partial [Sphingobacteriia bacterium]|nr:hypothetical protein [Sphingobacteriia bacterium]